MTFMMTDPSCSPQSLWEKGIQVIFQSFPELLNETPRNVLLNYYIVKLFVYYITVALFIDSVTVYLHGEEKRHAPTD